MTIKTSEPFTIWLIGPSSINDLVVETDKHNVEISTQKILESFN